MMVVGCPTCSRPRPTPPKLMLSFLRTRTRSRRHLSNIRQIYQDAVDVACPVSAGINAERHKELWRASDWQQFMI